MKVIEVGAGRGVEVAKEMLWLAWSACGGPMGMGFLQDRPSATKEDVWAGMRGATDYPGRSAMPKEHEVSADYVFGRMMKMHFKYDDHSILVHDDRDLQPDYQSWCVRYHTYDDLLAAALKSLSIKAPPKPVTVQVIEPPKLPAPTNRVYLHLIRTTQAVEDYGRTRALLDDDRGRAFIVAITVGLPDDNPYCEEIRDLFERLSWQWELLDKQVAP